MSDTEKAVKKLLDGVEKHIADGSARPALEALDGGKATEKPSQLRSEKELRDALANLGQRHAIQKNYLQLQASVLNLRGMIDASLDLRVIEAHIEALRFVLKEADSIR